VSTKGHLGITLVELLIALAILAIIVGLSSSGIINGLRVQSVNEAATATQAKLRRINEVVTQELRSAVLGALSNTPYPSGGNSVSFVMLDGGAGYQVLPHDSGQNNSFVIARNLSIHADAASPDDLDLVGRPALIVNNAGQATIFDVTNVQRNGPVANAEFRVVHPACGNTIDYTPNTLLFQVRTIGFRFDPDSGTLYSRESGGSEVPLAFDLERFDLEYVYLADDGTLTVRNEPFRDAGGTPLKRAVVAGRAHTLQRLNVVLAAATPSSQGEISRTYAGQVEMTNNDNFAISAVVPCR
jgi:prepilin-type N-terminal cleavage/methylation domain-containing protein